jgi:uncharacterized membrane protein YhhN
MIAAAIATAICATAVVRLVIAERRHDRAARMRWKPLASAAFVAVPLCAGAFAGDRDRALAGWIVAGLVLGAIGDLALMFDSDRGFLAGLGAFLFGHVAYGVGLAHLVPPRAWLDGAMGIAAPLAVGVSGAVLAWLWPRLGALRLPVIAYVLVIATMLIAGLAVSLIAAPADPDARHRLTAGAVLFFASDLAVAREKFVGSDPWNRTIGLPVYYAAQLGFGWALITA